MFKIYQGIVVKKALVTILILFIPMVSYSYSYEMAYKEIDSSPGYIRNVSCYKYHMVLKELEKAVHYWSALESESVKYLRENGYNSSDIDIALFAKKESVNSQWGQIFLAKGIGEIETPNRYLKNIKRACDGNH